MSLYLTNVRFRVTIEKKKLIVRCKLAIARKCHNCEKQLQLTFYFLYFFAETQLYTESIANEWSIVTELGSAQASVLKFDEQEVFPGFCRHALHKHTAKGCLLSF